MMRLWDGTLGTLAVTSLLSVSAARLQEIAGRAGYRSLNGRWAVADVKNITRRFIVLGSDIEQAAARTAITGALRGEIDQEAFNGWA
jgi:hypothetical protein